MTSASFIDVRNLRREFDVSKPWLNRVLEVDIPNARVVVEPGIAT